MRVRVHEEPDALDRLGPALEDLHAATGTPVTARRPWLATWLACYPDLRPLVFAIEGPAGLHGAALLVRRRRRGITQVVGIGHRQSDYQRFAARDPQAAEALAEAVADRLRALPGPWQLLVEQLPAGDSVAAGISRRLRWSVVLPGEGAPRVRFDAGREPREYMSRNTYQTERNGWNRIRRAGLAPALASISDPRTVQEVLPELERVRRSRDLEARGRSSLDDERAGEFWRRVILEHARLGQAEIVVLRLNGQVAAYDVCLVDEGAHRMWDGRLDPRFSRFSPGRLVDLAVLRRALADPTCTEYDWMRGEERYKLRTSSEVQPSECLLAWSSWRVRGVVGSPRVLRSFLKRLKDRHPALERVWGGLRSLGRRA